MSERKRTARPFPNSSVGVTTTTKLFLLLHQLVLESFPRRRNRAQVAKETNLLLEKGDLRPQTRRGFAVILPRRVVALEVAIASIGMRKEEVVGRGAQAVPETHEAQAVVKVEERGNPSASSSTLKMGVATARVVVSFTLPITRQPLPKQLRKRAGPKLLLRARRKPNRLRQSFLSLLHVSAFLCP